MTGLAADLTDRVIPFVPVRQFVLSVPHRVRYLLAYDHARCIASRLRSAPGTGASSTQSGGIPAVLWLLRRRACGGIQRVAKILTPRASAHRLGALLLLVLGLSSIRSAGLPALSPNSCWPPAAA